MEPPTPESEFARSLMDNAVTHFDLSTYKYVQHFSIICACIILMSSCAACPVAGGRPTGLILFDLPGRLQGPPVGTAGILRTAELARFY